MTNDPRSDARFDRDAVLSEWIELADGRPLIISSEGLEFLPPSAVSTFLDGLSRSFDQIDVVCYFRHPVEWIESSFKWHVMKGSSTHKTADEFVAAVNFTRRLDYAALARRWCCSGHATMFPRVYGSDVVTDFASLLGLSVPAKNGKVNTSPKNITAKIAALIGLSQEEARKFVAKLDARIRSITDRDAPLLSPSSQALVWFMAEPGILRSWMNSTCRAVRDLCLMRPVRTRFPMTKCMH